MASADRHAQFDRLVIQAVTGSGKSTAAARISAATGIRWVSVDDHMWLPGWVPVEPDEQRRIAAEFCAGDRWILDTAYGAWRDIPLGRADLVVGLDYPRWLSLARLVRRTARRILTRTPVCNGNVESLRTTFSRGSILLWHFQSFSRKRARIRAAVASPEGPPVLVFTRPAQLERWIASLLPS